MYIVPHIHHNVEKFLSDEECALVISELTESIFTKERRCLTMEYCANSKGSRSRIPTLSIINNRKLSTRHVSQDVPVLSRVFSQVLCCQWICWPTSFISSHSDDEKSIHPAIKMFTVSVGKEATVCFTNTLDNSSHEHKAGNGSMNSMSRKSQGCFNTRLTKIPLWRVQMFIVCLSLTFRSVHCRNNNSTIVCGCRNAGG